MQTVRRELSRLLGGDPVEIRPVTGGDIGQGFRVETASGEIVFAKAYAAGAGSALEGLAPAISAAISADMAAEMAAAEAHGLAWLAEAAAIRVPGVRAVSEPGGSDCPVLAIEWIEPGEKSAATDEALGRDLAALHDFGAPGFGLDVPNFIGWLPQSNASTEPGQAPHQTWAEFYRDCRLVPQLERADEAGLLTAELAARAGRLLDRLPDLLGPEEPPARLHGDLWGGNWLVAAGGEPVLIDPAVYGGHREIDLAMMRLFGGFSERVFAAYQEATPLADGHLERVPLHQLYPLLVHLNLFGASYAKSVESALSAFA
jgi:fructosamine-3-kinase